MKRISVLPPMYPKSCKRRSALKLRTLLTLLLIVLVLMNLSANPANSPITSENAYGIEQDKLYPGSLVLELLTIAEDEAADAVKNAYAEGYKAGRIDGASIWGDEYRKLQADYAQAARRPGWLTVTGFAVGALGVGIIAGMMVR
jgi:hypothetical protein